MNIFREPGQTSLQKIGGLSAEIKFNAALLPTLPLVFLFVYTAYIYFFKGSLNPIVGMTSGAIGAALLSYYLVKLLKLRRKRRILQLEYQSELAVGQALNQLAQDGKYVYHDFPADKFNINHIVVGPEGMFTVGSIARSKPARSNNRQDASTVVYDGKMLNFPNEDNYKIIEQAEWQASWLSEWISRAIGEPVAARAVVALPDWFVKRTSAEGISVVNPNQFPSLFKHIKPRPLSAENIARIVDQIERKCRATVTAAGAQEGIQPTG